jgi:hypothetical protein
MAINFSHETPRCGKCGGHNIRFDAFAAWNDEMQMYEVQAVMDEGHVCEDCDNECPVVWGTSVTKGPNVSIPAKDGGEHGAR